MYSKDGEQYYVVDSHIALWDARPENQRNIHGKQFIDCFYDYHRNLSPESEVWSYEEYLYQGGERLMRDVFADGIVDHAIFQPARLAEFYHRGFGQTEEAFALAQAHPDKLTYNHYWDPRDGENGLDALRANAERMHLKGVKLYTADWHGESRGWKLTDPMAYRYFALWTPKWLVERFVDFQIPEDMTEYAPLTTALKKKVLGLNAAKLYDLPVPAHLQLPDADETATGPREPAAADLAGV